MSVVPTKSTRFLSNEAILSSLDFNNSIQPKIISSISAGKIITANTAACRLFGYCKKELVSKISCEIFDTQEGSFKKMHKQRRAKGQSRAVITIITKGGSRIQCEATSAVFLDGSNSKKSITAIVELIENTGEVPVSNSWIKNIAETSYDVMWDWNLDTNEIYVGNSVKEVFGYAVRNNNVRLKDIKRCLSQEEQRGVEVKLSKVLESGKKTWNASFQFRRRDGTFAFTKCRANIVRNDQGKATRLIGAMIDVSDLEDLKKTIRDLTIQREIDQSINLDHSPQGKLYNEYGESFRLVLNSSVDVLFDVDLEANHVMISDAYQREFGYKLAANMTPTADWLEHIHPDDKLDVQQDYLKMLSSTETKWVCKYRFLKFDNTIADIESTRIILRRQDGKPYRLIGNMHDVSKKIVVIDAALRNLKIKEEEIADAFENGKNTVRSDIGRELHDNVNQLLGASNLYITMAIQGRGDSRMYLDRSSEYTLSAIQAIRELSKELTTTSIMGIGLCQSVKNSINDLMEVSPVTISFQTRKFNENEVSNSFQLAVFRIVQQQLNNIMTHAHADKVKIVLVKTSKYITLTISDNGIGFNMKQKHSGIGMKNIETRAASLNAAVAITSRPGDGCVLSVIFPFKTCNAA